MAHVNPPLLPSVCMLALPVLISLLVYSSHVTSMLLSVLFVFAFRSRLHDVRAPHNHHVIVTFACIVERKRAHCLRCGGPFPSRGFVTGAVFRSSVFLLILICSRVIALCVASGNACACVFSGASRLCFLLWFATHPSFVFLRVPVQYRTRVRVCGGAAISLYFFF